MSFVLFGALWFGALGLVAEEPPVATPQPVGTAPAAPSAPALPPPAAIALVGAAAAAAALLCKDSASALGLKPPDDALVVFVPGHGQGEGSEAFATLIDLMDLDPEAARFFDYRLVTGLADPVASSVHAPIDDTVRALNAYLAGVAEEGRAIWLVGFSKGGASVAAAVAAWDAGAFGPADAIEQVFLLDPPMAAGTQGWLQSLGTVVGSIPDDGGYDPVSCGFLWWGCHDQRDHLGDASGVDVLVVRNPKALITSFNDHPDGLRVVDAPDEGRGFLDQMWRNPLAVPGRVAEAHEAVLTDPEVAVCLVSEMLHPGSCALEPAGSPSGSKTVAKRRRRRGFVSLIGPKVV